MKVLLKERGGDPDDPRKHHPLDFILWQKSKIHEPAWESPFGSGRPGWHIECSAMIYKHLGKQIDIHGGGHDLIYPHHESEIAQSESFTNTSPFVKYWMHVAMVYFHGEKMSKSLGNVILVSDLLKKYQGNTIRYMLLSHHYSQEWEYKESEMHVAQRRLDEIYNALHIQSQGDKVITSKKYDSQFHVAMDNNLNIPEGLEVLRQLSNAILKDADNKNVKHLQKILKKQFVLLGFTH